MRWLVSIAIIASCSHDKAVPDRWSEIEQLAAPTVPAGSQASFDPVIANVNSIDEVPSAALDGLIAWSAAGGGLPWRAQRVLGKDPLTTSVASAMKAGRVAMALIDRRADATAIGAALYLAQRLRAEGTTLVEASLGVSIADHVRTVHAAAHPSPDEIRLAPTDAELRRSLAAEGVTMAATLTDHGGDARPVHRAYQDFLLGAPDDRVAFLARFDAAREHVAVGELADARFGKLVHDMFDQVGAYRQWLAAR